WGKGHVGIAGNERADTEAKRAAQGESSPPDELPHFLRADQPLPFSLSAMRQAHDQTLLRQWKASWEGSSSQARIAHIDKSLPFTRFIRHSRDMNLRRPQYSLLVQIRIGHIGLNAHLHKMKLVDSPNCPSCQERGILARETLRHFLFDCPTYRSDRTVMTRALGRNARNLEAIFHDKKGIYALLRYVGRTRRLQHTFGDV
ncbi:hypothetical protein HDZ31DRAFT_25388, partial [Schizophyllum fasciatum]